MLSRKRYFTDERAKSLKFNIIQSHGNTTFYKLFIQVFKDSFMAAQKHLKKYIPIIKALD